MTTSTTGRILRHKLAFALAAAISTGVAAALPDDAQSPLQLSTDASAGPLLAVVNEADAPEPKAVAADQEEQEPAGEPADDDAGDAAADAAETENEAVPAPDAADSIDDEEAEGPPSGIPQAQHVPLDAPIIAPAKPAASSSDSPDSSPAAAETDHQEEADAPESEEAIAAADEPEAEIPHLILLGTEVPPNTSTRLAWAPTQSFEGIYIATPVLVVNGIETGPTLCLTAAVHGDELNGIETVRRVLYNLDPAKLKGAVIGVPIVNLQGFHSGSRYLSDRRDLNRHFPGDPKGSSAARLAHSFFHEVVKHCSAVVDLHTGSFYRTNLPQLRGDLSNPQVVQLTKGFGSTVVLHSEGSAGTLRRAAVDAGIPAVTMEAGGPSVLDEASVSHTVKGIHSLLNHLGMISRFSLWGDPEPVYYNSAWQRAPVGGIVFSRVSLGQTVKEGEELGTVTNPITNVRTRIRSSYNGRVIGMALNQVVQPGFATHHIGIAAPKEQVSPPAEVAVTPPTVPEDDAAKPEADSQVDDGTPVATATNGENGHGDNSEAAETGEQDEELEED